MNEKPSRGIIPDDLLTADEPSISQTKRSTLTMIDKKRRQVAVIKRVVIFVWLCFAAMLIVGGVIEASVGRSALVSTLAITCRALFVIALVLTVSWYARSVAIRFDLIQQGLSAIQERLDKLPREDTGP